METTEGFLSLLADDWMMHLYLPQLRTVLFMVSNGYIGDRGLPASERPRLAALFGRSGKTITDMFRGMIQIGVLNEWRENGESYVAVNLRWQPRRTR